MNRSALNSESQFQLTGGHGEMFSDGTASNRTSIAELWQTLMRRRTLFLWILIGFPILVTLCTLLIPRTYTVHAKLMTGPAGAPATQPQGELPMLNQMLLGFGTQTSESYVELMQEEPVARGVIDKLHLNIAPKQLLEHLHARPVINTSVLDLTATWSDPVTAATLANTMSGVFMDRERDIVSREAISAMDYIGRRLPDARRDMQAAATALASYQSAHSIADLTNQTQSQIAALAALDAKIGQAATDAGQAKAQLSSVERVLAQTSPTLVGNRNVAVNPVVDQLSTQLAQTEVQLKTAESQYTPQHPAVIALKQQEAELQRRIAALPQMVNSATATVPNPVFQQFRAEEGTLKGTIAAQQALASGLRRQRATMEAKIRKIPNLALTYTDLARRAKSTEDIYNALQRKYDEASVSRDAALSDVALIAPASPSSYAIMPDPKLNLLVSIVIGFFLALVGVALAEVLDTSLKPDEKRLEETFGLPVLVTVPQLNEKKSEGLAPGKEKALPPIVEDVKPGNNGSWLRAMWVESFVRLVGNLRYSTDRPLRSIAITSASAGDGKSVVASNAAIAMAEFEPRILLVDCDLRRPTLHKILGVEDRRPGVSDVLVGRATLQGAIRPTKHAGLDFLPAGTESPNPAKLLQGRAFDGLLEEALAHYSLIVFDTPAMSSIFDAGLISARVDGSVIVASAGQTSSHAVKRLIRDLSRIRNVNLLGLVLNRVSPTRAVQSEYADYIGHSDQPVLAP